MTGRSSGRFRALLALLALLAIGFALVATYVPGLLPGVARRFVREAEGIDPRTGMLFAGLVAGILGAFAAWLWRVEGRPEGFADRTPETPARRATVTGEELTGAFERRRAGEETGIALEDGPLGEALRDVLVEVFARELDDPAAAERHVDEGHWTGDRYAAAFLTASDGIDYPLHFRILAWLYPGLAYEFRARRALRAVERTCEDRLSTYDPPEAETGWWGRLRAVLADGGDPE